MLRIDESMLRAIAKYDASGRPLPSHTRVMPPEMRHLGFKSSLQIWVVLRLEATAKFIVGAAETGGRIAPVKPTRVNQ